MVGDVRMGGGLNKIMCVTVDRSWGLRNEIQTSDKTHWRSKSTRKQVHELMKKMTSSGLGCDRRVVVLSRDPLLRTVVREVSQSEAAGAGALTRWN